MVESSDIIAALKAKIPEAQITPRFKNIVVSRNNVHVMVNMLGENPQVKNHTPLAWYAPGLILGAVASSLFHPSLLGKFVLYAVGISIGAVLYAVLKKQDLAVLKRDVENVIGN